MRIDRDPKSQEGGIRHNLPVQAHEEVGSKQRCSPQRPREQRWEMRWHSMVRRQHERPRRRRGGGAWQKGRQRVPGDVSRSMVRRRHCEYRLAVSHQWRPDGREQQERRREQRLALSDDQWRLDGREQQERRREQR